jgi:hypothetical protein
MPHVCATNFFSAISNRLFSITLSEHASGLGLIAFAGSDAAPKMVKNLYDLLIVNYFLTWMTIIF